MDKISPQYFHLLKHLICLHLHKKVMLTNNIEILSNLNYKKTNTSGYYPNTSTKIIDMCPFLKFIRNFTAGYYPNTSTEFIDSCLLNWCFGKITFWD